MVRGSPSTVSAHRRRLKLVAFERMRGDLQAAFMSNFIDWHGPSRWDAPAGAKLGRRQRPDAFR